MRTNLLLLFLFLLITFSCFSQTLPAPQLLPYQQGFSNLPHNSTAYPSGWQGWLLGGGISTSFKTNPPTDDEALNGNSSASVSTGGVHNYNGAIGLLPTGVKDPALVLTLSTLCNSAITIAYQVSTMRNSGTRTNELGLQYRIGASGDFIDMPGTTYQNDPNYPQTTGTIGQFPTVFTITMPPAADNQSLVQIRWLTRDVPTIPPGTGDRASFSIDNVAVYGLKAEASFMASDDKVCTGTMVNFTNTSNNAITFEWLENNIQFSSSVNASRAFNNPGTYLVSLIANPGTCADTTSINIEVADPIGPIPAVIIGNTTVCEGASETYSIPQVTNATAYHWVLPSGWNGSSTTENISPLIGASPGDIEVFASNACDYTNTVSLLVHVNILPPQPGPVTGKDSVCEADMSIYEIAPVSGASSYAWYLPAFLSGSSVSESINIDFLSPGNGTLSVSAINSCGPGPAQSFDIAVHPLPIITVDINPPLPVCGGELLTITASGAIIYNWSPAGTNPLYVKPMATTSYTVYGSSIHGCFNSLSVTVEVKETPQPTITQDGSKLTASPHHSYQWYFLGGPIPNANAQTYTVTEAGVYSVEVTDTVNECVGKSNLVNVQIPGVEEYLKKQIKVYPNPNNGIFYINVGEERNCMVQISDLTGKNLSSLARISEPDLGILKIELGALSPGIYWIQIRNEHLIRTEKIIKR